MLSAGSAPPSVAASGPGRFIKPYSEAESNENLDFQSHHQQIRTLLWRGFEFLFLLLWSLVPGPLPQRRSCRETVIFSVGSPPSKVDSCIPESLKYLFPPKKNSHFSRLLDSVCVCVCVCVCVYKEASGCRFGLAWFGFHFSNFKSAA